MAFSIKQIKSILSDGGMPAENLEQVASEICARHSTDLDAIKEERDNYKKDAESLASVKAELDALKDDGYKDRYEKEHAAYEEYKTEVAKERAMSAKQSAYTALCKDAGLSEDGIKKAVKYADWESVEVDDGGKIKDASKLMKAVKEEWSAYIQTNTQKGADTPTPPTNTGNAIKSRADIYKQDEHGKFVLSATERQAALSQLINSEKG